MVNIGIIGCGQWGFNHLRIFFQMPNCKVLICCDADTKRLEAIKKMYPHLKTTNNYKEILKRKDIQAVVVATPTATHYKIVKDCLVSHKDVFCEKPMSASPKETKELLGLSKRLKKILMIGYVFVFNPGIIELRNLIKSGKLGNIYYLCSARTNLGPIRNDVNVVWDLACHDVSILWFLLGKSPIEVTAKGGIFLQKGVDDVVFASLTYPGNILCNIHASWLEPRKIREIIVVGNLKMARWADLDTVAPITIYDKNVPMRLFYENFGEFHLYPHEGDITIPKIALYEPLKAQDEHFLDCLISRKKPICDAGLDLEVVKVLEAIRRSMRANGKPVRLGAK